MHNALHHLNGGRDGAQPNERENQMAKIKYVARLDGRIVGTRTSAAGRIYTHAIVINGHDKTDHVVTWCGRIDLARNEQRKYARYGYRAEIAIVETVEPKTKPATKVEAIAKPAAPSPANSTEVNPPWSDFFTPEKILATLRSDAPAAKPALCYIVIETNKPGERVVIVKRGELGYFQTDLDRGGSADDLKQAANELNAKMGVDMIEARAMRLGSMFGWNVPAANSDHQRDAIAEADAVGRGGQETT